MTSELRVGLVQLASTQSKHRNLEKLKKMIVKCEADLVILPEYFMADIKGLAPVEVYDISEDVNGPLINEISRLAAEYSTFILATMFEKTEKKPKVYNSVVFINPKGDVIGVYRKIHLFDAYGYKESDYMLHGDKPSPIINIGSARIAAAICFDIRFPELYRYYALKGANIVVNPSAWYKGPFKEETLRFLAQARAHENTFYMIIVNQCGTDFTGRSMIVNPYGIVEVDLGTKERYLEYQIDMNAINEARKVLPVLKLRRGEIYRSFNID